ncbi:A/G-specific adenine glycosylase [Fimbriiglobus ruber]|uniref:Adenine DNA glycosylase n=1 Tax=Fimbriiglobus ruber TaxID=1908690 RepID=A0A225DMN9_9BACT|nr:A/G-specific adenine glycosylase [Fimbriiglobus ruber]OWK38726.1 A/G-specific adenine glycosylase [Fimbriiglobus ruber]
MPEFVLPAGWTSRTLAAVRRKLLAWFDAHRRDLPWRADRDPYRIWVSEVMLQQTTVAAVVPYFERFLASFPTVAALAAADEQAVLRHWEGLGYYRRARHLHRAAKDLAAAHGDALPDDPAVWAELPGVGPYILGAVMSQAFDRKLPIVEANSLRVLSRWFGYRGDPREGAGKKWVWKAAAAVLPTARVGDFNQALMELGALVCSPTAPACGTCPVAKWCEANRLGLQAQIPPATKAKKTVEVREVAVVIRDGAKVLLCRRGPDASRWANMWEVPHGEAVAGETVEAAVRRVARELTRLDVTSGPELVTIRHGVTRFAITMTCLEAIRKAGTYHSDFYAEGRWVDPHDLKDYPVSSPQRRLADELTRASRQLRLI